MLKRSDDPDYIPTDCGCNDSEKGDKKPKKPKKAKITGNATITEPEIENPTEISKTEIPYAEKSAIEQLIQLRDEVIDTIKEQYKLMKMVFSSKERYKWKTFVSLLEGYHKSLGNVQNMIRVYNKVKK